MRSGVLLSLALGLFSAESLASPCKPQSGSSSVVIVSSEASTSVTSSELSLSSTVTETSSAETESETSKSTESSGTTEVASSTESAISQTASATVSSADSTTLSTESTTAVSSTESTTSTSATESTSSTSVTESATSRSTTQPTTESAESSTSEAASTSSSSVDACATPNPNPIFRAVVQGSGGNQVILTNGQHGNNLFLSTTSSGYSTMGFTVEPCTNYLRQTDGKYICVTYGPSDYFPPTLVTCQLPTISWFKPVTCEQPVAGQPLVCNAPRGECTPGCHETGGTPFSQFYSMASPDPFQPATLLYFGNSVEEGAPGTYTAVDFVAQHYVADPPAPTE
ncbi:uncharacterized protein NECHADRAFT_75986 [Fusarium vanettenii 77-13-4]|uniref:Ig-like domain-containing protein n=1 Tax=Fusarium vanettenii (strain ATCC MYA-4622 / CBS 123669 / FGSC 9596 / NRRL 45880 / 77-13-4) TaxID=660122 RepID=C7Z657_FUSV7|nr:uncharacterized protein NECHADRAFT_75986 [Fusarium vanettenii 77-13-4]EEU40069.1 predicted protein [Fusarium vanettenii 77-13-4]